MNTIQQHLKRYPKARTSTLEYLQKRDETTKKLEREITARLPWWKRLARKVMQ